MIRGKQKLIKIINQSVGSLMTNKCVKSIQCKYTQTICSLRSTLNLCQYIWLFLVRLKYIFDTYRTSCCLLEKIRVKEIFCMVNKNQYGHNNDSFKTEKNQL